MCCTGRSCLLEARGARGLKRFAFGLRRLFFLPVLLVHSPSAESRCHNYHEKKNGYKGEAAAGCTGFAEPGFGPFALMRDCWNIELVGAGGLYVVGNCLLFIHSEVFRVGTNETFVEYAPRE